MLGKGEGMSCPYPVYRDATPLLGCGKGVRSKRGPAA